MLDSGSEILNTRSANSRPTLRFHISLRNSVTHLPLCLKSLICFMQFLLYKNYEGRTESHEQRFFACELGTADEGECGGRWNLLLCYP